MAVDREYKVRIQIISETSGAKEAKHALDELEESGSESGHLLNKAFEKLNLTHREEHQLLRVLGSQFGELGHLAHFAMSEPLFVVAGLVMGIKALIDRQKEEKQQAEETAAAEVESFEKSEEAAGKLSEALQDIEDKYNRWQKQLHDPESNALAETFKIAIEKARVLEAELEKLAKLTGATPEQISAMKEAAGGRESVQLKLDASKAAQLAAEAEIKAAEAKARLAKARVLPDQFEPGFEIDKGTVQDEMQQRQAEVDRARKMLHDAQTGFAAGPVPEELPGDFQARIKSATEDAQRRLEQATAELEGAQDEDRALDEEKRLYADALKKATQELEDAEKKAHSLREEANTAQRQADAATFEQRSQRTTDIIDRGRHAGFTDKELLDESRAVSDLMRGIATKADFDVMKRFAAEAKEHGLKGTDIANLANDLGGYFSEVKTALASLSAAIKAATEDIRAHGQNLATRTLPGN